MTDPENAAPQEPQAEPENISEPTPSATSEPAPAEEAAPVEPVAPQEPPVSEADEDPEPPTRLPRDAHADALRSLVKSKVDAALAHKPKFDFVTAADVKAVADAIVEALVEA